MNSLQLLEIEEHHDYGHPGSIANTSRRCKAPRCTQTLKPRSSRSLKVHRSRSTAPELKWQNWTMRLGFNYREGPVIYQVSFDDKGTKRDVAYRMSFAEMIVPLPRPLVRPLPAHRLRHRRWGLGCMTTSLELEAATASVRSPVDATLADSKGELSTSNRRSAMKKTTQSGGSTSITERCGEVRRQRRMVVSRHATVANHEYLVYWRFHQDGNIECEVRATGIMVTTPMLEGRPAALRHRGGEKEHLRPVPPHFLVARLDLDVDGDEHRDGGRLVRTAGVGGPVRSGAGLQGRTDQVRVRIRSRFRLVDPAVVEGRQPQQTEQGRHRRVVQAGARGMLPRR